VAAVTASWARGHDAATVHTCTYMFIFVETQYNHTAVQVCTTVLRTM
jgi:hypothetical protein